MIEETIEGGSPATVDYSIAYDTASGELLQNMMDNLVVFNGEHTDQFLPAIATSWTATPLGPAGTGIDSGLPISGLVFESVNQSGPNAKYFYRYDFTIRQGVFFQLPYSYSLTPEDVAFSFQRTMLMDTSGGPQWMLQEPLLDLGADSLEAMADLTNMTQVAEVGALIQSAVQYNSTDVWFNLMFPSSYAPFMQILTQTWSSIESKQWINNQAIGTYGRDTWPGTWPNFTAWLHYWNPPATASPLDVPTPIMYGSGPYVITTLDYTDNFWSGTRNVAYWRGWPAEIPALSATTPEGYVDTIYVTWAYTWPTRLADITSGATDFVAVPRQNLADVFKGGLLTNYPLDGIREIEPLPSLAVDAFFFTFNINPGTLYGPIGPADAFGNSLIPSDFFGNTNWGINVRKGFAQAFNYATFINTAYLGEAIHPATAIIPGLSYYDPTVVAWSYNLAAANASLNLVGPDSNGKMLKNVGFTLTLLYNTGNLARLTACNLLAAAITGLNPLYTVNVVGVAWATYLNAAVVQKLPMFSIGWLADFPDPHDFALPFYRTGGSFAAWQAYTNPAMDALVDQGIATPDGPARATVYHNIQVLAVSDVPSFTLDQAIGRHFERDWVVGWYYNPACPGQYYYNLWKWYFQAEAQLSTAQNPPATTAALAGFNLPVDVNYDGKVDMKDIGIVAHAFGTSFGPPQDPRWVFRGDINNDRKIDMKDIGLVAKQFGKTSQTWNSSTVSVMISPGAYVHASPTSSVELNFAHVTAWGYVTADNISTVPVPLDHPKGPYYVVSVTASFSSNVTVSLAFDGSNMTETQKSNLQMMQYTPEMGGWINITTYVDTTNNVIYGETTHFSLIGIH
jgi:peptide/nickel transport system substrate-binding protein